MSKKKLSVKEFAQVLEDMVQDNFNSVSEGIGAVMFWMLSHYAANTMMPALIESGICNEEKTKNPKEKHDSKRK